jgi:lipoate-protein ligase B
VLADWGLRGIRSSEGRGVWIEDRKIASLGLNVRRWVTMHGIALNIDPDMSHWDLINACGMRDAEVTSMATEASKQVPIDEVREAFLFHFGRVFECDVQSLPLPEKSAGQALA